MQYAVTNTLYYTLQDKWLSVFIDVEALQHLHTDTEYK